MVKMYTIGALKVAKNDPTVIADGAFFNGGFFTIGSDGKHDLPVAGNGTTSQTKDLWVALNDAHDDDAGRNKTIASGEKINAFQVKAFDGLFLEVDEDNITYKDSETYAGLDVGDILVAGTDGKLSNCGTTYTATYFGVNFKIAEKIVLGTKKGVRVQVVVA